MDINTDDLHMKKFPYPAPLEQSVPRSFAGDTDERDGYNKVSQSDITVVLRTVRFAITSTDDVRNGYC